MDNEDKRKQLFLTQKATLLTFLRTGAISQAQFDKSFGDLCRKMGFADEHNRKDGPQQ